MSTSDPPTYDWDSLLLNINWTNVNWRTILPHNISSQLPWEQLQDSTLEHLALLHDDYDRKHKLYPKEETTWFRPSPAMEELERRYVRELVHPMFMAEQQDVRDWICDRDRFEDGRKWQPVAPAEEDWVRDEETVKNPFLTLGFELELPIAVYRRTRDGIPDPHPEEKRWLADISDEKGDPDLSHVRKVVVDRVLTTLNEDTGMRFIPLNPEGKYTEINRDRRAVVLPHMNLRYGAFTVYAMAPQAFATPPRREYADAPRNEFDPYHWEVIKIASPVLGIESAREILTALYRICRVMRNNFRVHRDMPSIPVTTQVSVSSRAGIDLIDIKRFVSLVAILRDEGFDQLNRAHRSSRKYDDVCGAITRVSRLGGLSDADPLGIYAADDTILPQPPDDERAMRVSEMERNLPKEWIPALQGEGKLSDRIFFVGLWCYANVTDIARALGTSLISRKAEVMVKVTGDGVRSNPIDPKWTGKFSQDELYFDVVDSHRGVLEFRQCGGTLDPLHILCWMATCCCVVNAAKFTDEAKFKGLLTRILSGEESVMDALQIDPAVQDWYEKNFDGRKGFFEPPGSEVKWADPFYPPMP
ncbi:uncharacterized protein GGS22DRAFT_159359 [Annulohypoxylon maeteangense]|uniref:uncharacterized protein n=1 Tax=Annulohypoxylon maeteangense TaxID=1927788 RepID=UPI0020082371|nr:uncharacterized protein GGS22DRAFT_159359 [Annulohypoxylon maeteangense]KAI0885934.1 hypothetical protein GGS22DRAFT_159359 [Annulohypoxylon maeteangense]